MTASDLKRILDPLLRRVMQVASRALIKSTDTAGAIQKGQISVLADETLDGVDQVQEYGFASRPLPGAQAVLLSIAGSRDHPVIIATDDGRYRVKLENGEACLYDDQGQWVKIGRAKIDIKTGLKVEITAGGDVAIVAGGKITAAAPNIEATAATKVKATAPNIEIIAATKVTMTTPLLEVSGLIACAGMGAGVPPAAGSVAVAGALTAASVAATGNVSDNVGSMAGMRTKYNSHVHGGTPDPNPQM